MEKAVCGNCQKSKALLNCGCCGGVVCKNCALFLDEDNFSFMHKIPEDLSHTTYCNICFDSKVTPEVERYQQMMIRAKDVAVYLDKQGKETRLLRRTETPVRVKSCMDREETLLRLAFLAVERDFDAIIDVELNSEKVRQGGYQTLIWSGKGIPTHIDASKLNK